MHTDTHTHRYTSKVYCNSSLRVCFYISLHVKLEIVPESKSCGPGAVSGANEDSGFACMKGLGSSLK